MVNPILIKKAIKVSIVIAVIVLLILSATDVIPWKKWVGLDGGGEDLSEEDKKHVEKLNKIVKDIVVPIHENDPAGTIKNTILAKMNAQAEAIVTLANMEEEKRNTVFGGSTGWKGLDDAQKTVGARIFVVAQQQTDVAGFKEFVEYVKSLNDSVETGLVSIIDGDSTKDEACAPMKNPAALGASILKGSDGEKLPLQPMAYSSPMQTYLTALAENDHLDKECLDLSVIAEEV